jgi:hypothetical protein
VKNHDPFAAGDVREGAHNIDILAAVGFAAGSANPNRRSVGGDRAFRKRAVGFGEKRARSPHAAAAGLLSWDKPGGLDGAHGLANASLCPWSERRSDHGSPNALNGFFW